MKTVLAIAALSAACLAFGAHATRAEVVVASMAPTLCLDVNQSTNNVALWGCHGGVNQNFFTAAYGQQTFNGRCLDRGPLRQGFPNGDGDLIMAPCENKTSQRWSLVTDPNDAAGALRNEEGWCANIPRGNAVQGQQVIVWTCPQRAALNRTNDVWARGTYGSAAALGIAPAQLGAPGSLGVMVNGVLSHNGNALVSDLGGKLISPNTGGAYVLTHSGANVVRVTGGGLISVNHPR